MSIFSTFGTIHKANKELKKLEAIVDDLIYDIEHNISSVSILKGKYENFQNSKKLFIEIVSRDNSALVAPYFWKGQKVLVPDLGMYFNRLSENFELVISSRSR